MSTKKTTTATKKQLTADDIKQFVLTSPPKFQGIQFNGTNSAQIAVWANAVLGESAPLHPHVRGGGKYVGVTGDDFSFTIRKGEWLLIDDDLKLVHVSDEAIQDGSFVKPAPKPRVKK